MPVALGGDHSVTIPAVRAVRASPSSPGLVLIDTHLDTALDVGGEPLSHCCPITRAVDAGFDPRKIVLVGISGWMNPRDRARLLPRARITVIWLEEIWERAPPAVGARARDRRRRRRVYLTVDVDRLDGAYAPGTCCPTPGGLTSRELLELVRGVAAGGLLGVDVVETAPSLEHGERTANMAARIALDGLAAHCGAVT